MNNRTNTITYIDKKGRVIMQSQNDWINERRKAKEDRIITFICSFVALLMWIIYAGVTA